MPRLAADMLLDDRGHMTIGRRVKDAAHIGYPLIVVVGKRVRLFLLFFSVRYLRYTLFKVYLKYLQV